MTSNVRRLMLLASAATATAMFGSAAWAQSAPPLPTQNAAAPSANDAVDQIVVTGTRLQASGFTTPTPVTVQSSLAIQERGKQNIADALNEIPSFQPSSGPTQAQRNACSTCSASTVDLYGLGSGRTLILLDGRRFVGLSPGGQPDLGNIPTNLIDRVETVTGGASAQYGSDAVAGVVNFILNDKLEGIKANAQYGFSQRGDALEPGVNFAVGHTFADGKIHVIAGVDWSKNEGTGTQYTRDWGKLEPGVVGLTASRPAGTPANVVTNYQEWSAETTGGIITAGPLRGTAFGPGGAPYQFNYGSLVGPTLMVGGPNNNYGLSYTSQQRLENPTSRFSALSRVTFDVTDSTQVFIEGSFGRNRVNNNSSFSQQDNGDIPVLTSNPYLPASVAAQAIATRSTISVGGAQVPGFMLGRLNTDLGQWGGIQTNKVYRGVVGFKTNLWRDWKMDGYFQYGENDEDVDLFPVNTARFYQAAYAVKDPTSGNIVCGPTSTNPFFLNKNAKQQAILNTDLAIGSPGPCVPLNLFGPNANSTAARNYIRQNYDNSYVTKQLVGAINFSGSPFSTWAGPVNLAFGGEWRRDSSNNSGDQVALNGGYTEVNFTALTGSNGVYEGYAETGVPLLKDSMIGKSLDLDAAIRHTHYEYSGWVTTWKIGGTYEPTGWLRVRATESRDIKAPTVANLFSQGSVVLFQATNPANGVTDSLASKTVGNPNLLPEVANTFTGGFVVSPKWGFLNGFRMSVDYFDIKLNGAIGSISAPQVLQRYSAGQTQYAQYITFDNSPLGISLISAPSANLNTLKTNGIELEADYRVPLSDFNVPGRLDITARAVNTIRLGTYSTVGGVTTQSNRVGGTAFGDQSGPVPRWKSTITFNYDVGRFGTTIQTRMFSDFLYGTQYIGPGQAGYSPALPNSIGNNHVPGLAYWNMQIRYNLIQEGSRTLQLWASADNLFDKDPPILAWSMSQAGGIPYDFVGRTFKIGARFTM